LNGGNHQVFGPLATQDNDPPFAEPWQAQVMALAFAASQKGIFSPTQWSEALGAELRKKDDECISDERAGYYQAALRALETLLLASGMLAQETVIRRETEWRRAYLNTPHGMPVELNAGTGT
jgi:nitrile hydratase accessory protein